MRPRSRQARVALDIALMFAMFVGASIIKHKVGTLWGLIVLTAAALIWFGWLRPYVKRP